MPPVLARVVCQACGSWNRIQCREGTGAIGRIVRKPCSTCNRTTDHRIVGNRTIPGQVS